MMDCGCGEFDGACPYVIDGECYRTERIDEPPNLPALREPLGPMIMPSWFSHNGLIEPGPPWYGYGPGMLSFPPDVDPKSKPPDPPYSVTAWGPSPIVEHLAALWSEIGKCLLQSGDI